MTTVTIQEAGANLSELIHHLKPGDEVIITEKSEPVARLTAAESTRPKRILGTMKGTVTYMAPDFDAPLEGGPVVSADSTLDHYGIERLW